MVQRVLNFEGLGLNDLIDLFKTVSRYRGMLLQLEKRYSLIEVFKTPCRESRTC